MNNNSEFILDSFQIEAIESLNNGNSVLVSAPTSSGKTLIAEHAIREGLKNGQSVYYTAPIKALCNQKFRDFSNLFGIRNIGLLTGDNSIRTDAQVLVMTTEVLRNMLYSSNGVPQNLSFVILDEVHFLEDPYRGAVWEEIVLNLPKNVLLVALSATVSNAKELGDWITSVRGRTTVIERATRPVPLKGHYLVADRQGRFKTIRLPILIDGKENPKGRNFTNLSIRKKGQRGRRWSPPRRLEVLEELKRSQMLPAIHFIFSRKGCDEARNSFLRTGLNLNTKPEQVDARSYALTALSRLKDSEKKILDVENLINGFERGVASHHAGLIPIFKEITEELFSKGLIKVVYATETLAVGVNLPARSVVIEKLTKFNGETHEMLRPSQFTQLTGRAGRRGIDTEGHSLICWSPFVEFDEVIKLNLSKNFILNSAFNSTYNMLANLMITYERKAAEELLGQSFAQFQRRNNKNRKNKDLLNELDQRLKVLHSLNLAKGWELTKSGLPLTQIFNESDILVTQALSSGIFDSLEADQISAVVSCLTFRERRKDRKGTSKIFDKKTEESVSALSDLNDRITQTEKKFGLTSGTPPDTGFVSIISDWATGADLSDILAENLTPGEFVRNIRLTVDLLKQISNVARPETAKTALSAIDLLEKGVVSSAGTLEIERIVSSESNQYEY